VASAAAEISPSSLDALIALAEAGLHVSAHFESTSSVDGRLISSLGAIAILKRSWMQGRGSLRAAAA
jgi:hypothetical protein